MKLKQGVPRENILDTIRHSVDDQIFGEHLIDDRGIKNIKKYFGIDALQRHQNNQDIALSWIKDGIKLNIPQYCF